MIQSKKKKNETNTHSFGKSDDNSPVGPVLVLPLVGVELCPGGWVVGRGGRVPLLEKIEPTESLEVFIEEGILVARASLWDPEISSGLSSDEEDDGAKVPIEEPTG